MRKFFWVPIGILLIAFVPVLNIGCGGSGDSREPEMKADTPSIPDEPELSIVQTREDPGAYRGKEDSHVPQVAWEETESGLRVTVSVEHEMNFEKPHFIEWIGIWDASGRFLGEKNFSSEDDKATAVFELDVKPAGLRVYERCNLHGIWLAPVSVKIP